MSQDHSHNDMYQNADDIHEHGIRIHHDASEGFDHTEPAAGPIWGFTIGSVLLLIVVIFALEQYFDRIWNDAVTEKVLEAPSPQLQDVRNRDNWLLTHYQYVDKPKGQVRIPLEQAKQVFLKESAEGKLFYPAKPTLPTKEDQNSPGTPGAAAPAAAQAPPAAAKK